MKTSKLGCFTRTGLFLAAFAISAWPLQMAAQQAPTSADGRATVEREKLKADLQTPAGKKDKVVFYRTVTPQPDGSYTVVITNARDQVRMSGRYLDQNCSIPDGSFTFYHPNGNVESTGLYTKGIKTGSWICYHDSGTLRAERIYSGLNWEDQTIVLGLASKASSVEAPAPFDQ